MKKVFSLLSVVCLLSSMSYAAIKNEIDGVVKSNTETTEGISVNSSETKISPNGDGVLENIDFYVVVPQKKTKIKNWDFAIINKQTSNIVYHLSGKKEIPTIITWNGKKESGEVVEGTYGYIFSGKINKKDVSIERDEIIVDITPPYISIALHKDTYFADKEKNKFEKELSVILNTGDENEIDLAKTKLEIVNARNKVVKSWSFVDKKAVPEVVCWDGVDDIYGTVVPAGEYKIVFESCDKFNNSASMYSTFTVFDKAKGDSKIVVKEEPRGLLVNLSSNVLFTSGKSVLKKKAAASLDDTVDLLNTYPANKVLIEGYTDSTGDKKKNLKLSYDRAKAVYSYLVKKGIEADRLTAVGYGSKNPIASNKTAVGRAQNRRVNIIILKNSDGQKDKNITEKEKNDKEKQSDIQKQAESAEKIKIENSKETAPVKEEKNDKEKQSDIQKQAESAEKIKTENSKETAPVKEEKNEDIVDIIEILED